MNVTTLTLSSRRQSVFPQGWCRRVGLARGGPVNVFDLGDDGLLIRPVKAPTAAEVKRMLRATPVLKHDPEAATSIVAQALRKVRRA